MTKVRIALEDREAFKDALTEYWNEGGSLNEMTFMDISTQFLGDELLLLLTAREIGFLFTSSDGTTDDKKILATTLAALVKRAYHIGRRSLVQ